MNDDELEMEHGFLKAPWEVLMRTFRSNHKAIIKDAESIAHQTTAMVVDTRNYSSADEQSADEVAGRIDAIIARLESLQSRLHKARASDREGLDICLARIEHLARRTRPNFEAKSTLKTETQQQQAAPTPPTILSASTNGKVQPPRKAQLAPSEGLKMRGTGTLGGSDDSSDVDGNVNKDTTQLDAQARWEKTRLDRVLVDYMHRSGLYRSGAELAVSEGIEPLVDSQLFREARIVISALRARDCGPALKWCSENKRRLSKSKSTLEFQLHRQVFIEYARAGEKVKAIEYARKWLAGRGGSNSNTDTERSADIGHFMGLLVFPADTLCQPYKNMYAVHKWLELEEKFKQENYRLHGLTSESTLEVLLKAGLASLKTRKCGKSTEDGDGKDYKAECPTCNEPYLTLAEKLPRAHHVNSVLVCAISGELMDENNPPMALPNGNVYSFNALQDMATNDDESRVKDPKSQELFQFNQLRKCYIL